MTSLGTEPHCLIKHRPREQKKVGRVTKECQLCHPCGGPSLSPRGADDPTTTRISFGGPNKSPDDANDSSHKFIYYFDLVVIAKSKRLSGLCSLRQPFHKSSMVQY